MIQSNVSVAFTFWSIWLKADERKQQEIVKQLVASHISPYLKEDPVALQAVSTLVKSWFEDLALVVRNE